MIIWGQVHFWLRVEMVVKKHMMMVVMVVMLVTFSSRSLCLKQMLKDLDGDMQMLVYE